MSATVYYFSGTGNSYRIAEKISEGLSGALIPIASVIHEDSITVNADTVGIVFPVYYADVPNIVRSFIPKIKHLSSKYVFAVCNFGGGAGRAMKTVRALLRKNGAKLAAAYGVHMPQNAFLKPWVKNEKLLEKMYAEVTRICAQTVKKAKHPRLNRPLDFLLAPIAPIFASITRKYMLKTVGGGKGDTTMSMIYRLDCVFGVSDKCNGCAICAKVCPARNIAMNNGKPIWTHRCENCLACYNFCPQKAVSGIAQSGYHYLHPGYSITLAQQQSHAALK